MTPEMRRLHLDRLNDAYNALDDRLTDDWDLTPEMYDKTIRTLYVMRDHLIDLTTDDDGNVSADFGRVSDLGVRVETLIQELEW